jgi:hypothetical protein
MDERILIAATILFLALAAFGAGKDAGPQPGVPDLAQHPAQRMLVIVAQDDPGRPGIPRAARFGNPHLQFRPPGKESLRVAP